MTEGQKRAIRELGRLALSEDSVFQLIEQPKEEKGLLWAVVRIHLGPMEVTEDGLDLRAVEEFLLIVHPDFPFRIPTLRVVHDRFQGFPHVIWKHTICLYQGTSEWNPTNGLYGFFDRLGIWLGRAARNDMDPFDGPLEPPHHDTDFTQSPFVIRCNAPVVSGKHWFGLAELDKHPNRIELTGWNDLSSDKPISVAALAIILPQPMPMEFPTSGGDFLAALEKQGQDRNTVIKNLALAALLGETEDPIHLVLGFPMRRAADGSTKIHIAVWTADASLRNGLRLVLPKESDTAAILNIRQEVVDFCADLIAAAPIKWCKIMEDRDEIVQRRERESPLALLAGKDVLILGCGALGSWAAEFIARTRPRSLHLVDDARVAPGILSRQNYRLEDIGTSKASALKARLDQVASGIEIVPFGAEAHAFATEDLERFSKYSLVIDCTASSILQMKLERDWELFQQRNPPIIAIGIDGKAQRCLAVILPASSRTGIWSTYMQLKNKVCVAASYPGIVEAFYSERAAKDLFQPEPGCSDPTFVGSTADVAALVAQGLNLGVSAVVQAGTKHGFSFGLQQFGTPAPEHLFVDIPELEHHLVSGYRVRISRQAYREMAAAIKQNGQLRSVAHETGGLLWGMWDDSIGVVWVNDASGPPPDSVHTPSQFQCGTEGTLAESKQRYDQSGGTSNFLGYWHTHPGMLPAQSGTDIGGMSTLVSALGLNQQRALMLIQGRTGGKNACGLYVYESMEASQSLDLISVGMTQYELNADFQ